MLARLRQHWVAKLASLLAAAVLWYLLKQAIETGESFASPTRPPASAFPSDRLP